MSMNISRRAFMKGAAASTLAVAASTMLTGCNMPNLGDLFGGQRGSFDVNGTATIDVALSNFQFDSYHNELYPTLKVTNNCTSSTVKVSYIKNPGNADFIIYPEVAYIDEPTVTPDIIRDPNASTLAGKVIAAGASEEGTLGIHSPLKNWTGVALTLTLYQNGTQVGKPIVLNLTK